MVKLPPFLSAWLTTAVFVLPVVMLIASAAIELAGRASNYFTTGVASQPQRLAAYRRNVRLASALVCIAGLYALLLVPPKSQTSLSTYDTLFRHHIFDILAIAGIFGATARFQSRLNVERKALFYALIGAVVVAVAMYTNDEPTARILDAVQYAAMAGAMAAILSHTLIPQITASSAADHVIEHHGHVVRSSVPTWEYRRVRRCIKRYRAEALVQLGFVALRVLAKRKTRPTELLFVAAFDELDGCFKSELERLECGVPAARRLSPKAIALYSLYPQLDRSCSACGIRKPTTRRRCEACGTLLSRNLPSPYGRLDGPEETRKAARAASTSCRRRTEIVSALAAAGALFLAIGSVLPWFLPGAREGDILTAALEGRTAMYWYSGLSIAGLWWSVSLLSRPWLRPRVFSDLCFLVVMCASNVLVMVDLLLMRNVNPFRSFSMGLSTCAAVAGANVLVFAGIVESTIPRFRHRVHAAEQSCEVDSVTSEASNSHHLSKVARLYRLAARVIDPSELERGMHTTQSLVENAMSTDTCRRPAQLRPRNGSTRSLDSSAPDPLPSSHQKEKGVTPRSTARSKSARERPRIVKT
jgi:hypothetical protein